MPSAGVYKNMQYQAHKTREQQMQRGCLGKNLLLPKHSNKGMFVGCWLSLISFSHGVQPLDKKQFWF